jgi:hypothetical protein
MKSLLRSSLLAAGIVMIAGVHNANAQIDNTQIRSSTQPNVTDGLAVGRF